MEWTKIPTDLLQSRISDKEITAITKYQLLWAMLERQPTDELCLRYMTSKQLQLARDYMSAIEQRVNADIKSVESNRKRQKLFYAKNQTLIEKPNGYTNAESNAESNTQTNNADKIREDKNKEIYKESFSKFWDMYPKQRAGSKAKAYASFCKAIKENRVTEEQLLQAVKVYAESDEVKRGFAKGCAAWLNDDRFNNKYDSSESQEDFDNLPEWKKLAMLRGG